MHRGGWSLEKNCASAMERSDELSNSLRALRQFGTSSPTSERKRQRICVGAETNRIYLQAETYGSQKQKKNQTKTPPKTTTTKTLTTTTTKNSHQKSTPKTTQELEKFMLEGRKERFVNSNFAFLLIHTKSSLIAHIWYEGLLESKHFSEDIAFLFV